MTRYRQRETKSFIDLDVAYGLRNLLDGDVHPRVPVSFHRHSIRLARLIHLAPILQEECRGP